MSDFELEELGVFQVFTGAGTGSGFLIAPDQLVTNCHVVAPYQQVAVERRDKSRIVGTVRRVAAKHDLALVQLSEPLEAKILPLGGAEELKAKQPVSIIGFPIGLPLSLTEGVVSNPLQPFDGMSYIQTDAAVNPGNSGGPMVDVDQRIVGVTTCKITSAENVGFGIPAADVSRFLEAAGEQDAAFGVECPSCEALLETGERYCDDCGLDLEGMELGGFFDPLEEHPVVAFVEGALARADVDPVLARCGSEHWRFHSGSAPVRIFCCCSEHLVLRSPLAQPGKKKLGDLFKFLLSSEHAPMAFDLNDNLVGFNLTIHMSDVFSPSEHDALASQFSTFLQLADDYDNLLVEKYGCEPAPDTQLTLLEQDMGGH